MVKQAFGNRYIVTDETHSGGSGTVHICMDPQLERKVAIKFLGPHREKKRIYDEIAALQKIRSKNVVQIYDIVIEAGNNVGVVQEHLDGASLDDIEAGHDGAPSLLHLLYQMANGVADIHAQGLVHRDLKPANMRLTGEGLLKIFDFDLARTLENAETVGFKGTPGHAAPELYMFNAVFSGATDVYSIATSILEVATGDLPTELVALPGSVPPNPDEWVSKGGFGTITPALPPSLVSLLNAALSLDPGARPTAEAIRTEAAAQLLNGRHRALLVSDGTGHYCDAITPTLNLKVGNDALQLAYSGTDFVANIVEGDVYFNNTRVTVGARLRGSGVIGFGALDRRAFDRTFIPMDVSNPEVVL